MMGTESLYYNFLLMPSGEFIHKEEKHGDQETDTISTGFSNDNAISYIPSNFGFLTWKIS